jgi:large subunit ribosomal protein L3
MPTAQYACLASAKLCAIRVARLGADCAPVAGATNGVCTSAIVKVTATPEYEVGQELTAEIFSDGGYVDVTGTSKGKGFAGTMKRHGFKGQGASHGAQAVHRRPGSIGGCSTPGRVFKGTRMSGRMGGDRVTTQNLLVHKVDTANGVLLIKGAIPGRNGGLVMVRTSVKRGGVNRGEK